MTSVQVAADRPLHPWGWGLALLAGVLHALSVGWPFTFGLSQGDTLWWLQLGALAAVVAHAMGAQSPAAAARWVWLFTTVWLAATFGWLFIAMHKYGGLAAWLSLVALGALAGALATYYAGAVWVWKRVCPTPGWPAVLGFACMWLAAELARGTWMTGFGWGAIGYAHVDGPLRVYLPLVGTYGVAAIAAGWAASWGVAWHRRRWRGAVLCSACVLAPCLLPAPWLQWTQATTTLEVALLQGNIPQNEKFEEGTGVPLALEWYRQALTHTTADLVVAPETAIPLLPQQLPPGYWDTLVEHFAGGRQAALIGIPLGDWDSGYTNSVIGLSAGADPVWRYDKHHLVPFGEFIPPFFRWFTDLMHIPLGDFRRGPLGQASMVVGRERVAPNICYEDLYGEELATRFTSAATAPTVFANVSNLGWFDDSVALQQHLTISRARALEFQRPFVRATNTGATAIVSHNGEVTALLPSQMRGVLHGTVQGQSGMTPFATWASRLGLWPLWVLVVVGMGLAFRRRPA